MTTGSPVVYRYQKNIPKSGKSVIDFAGHKLCHRNIKADKSDLLVHVESGIVLRSYPRDTDRSVVLNDMAKNIEKLDHFLDNTESYEILDSKPELHKQFKEPESILAKVSAPHNLSHLDVKPIPKKQSVKKSYNLKDATW